jgi:hypothetical protein
VVAPRCGWCTLKTVTVCDRVKRASPVHGYTERKEELAELEAAVVDDESERVLHPCCVASRLWLSEEVRRRDHAEAATAATTQPREAFDGSPRFYSANLLHHRPNYHLQVTCTHKESARQEAHDVDLPGSTVLKGGSATAAAGAGPHADKTER